MIEAIAFYLTVVRIVLSATSLVPSMFQFRQQSIPRYVRRPASHLRTYYWWIHALYLAHQSYQFL